MGLDVKLTQLPEGNCFQIARDGREDFEKDLRVQGCTLNKCLKNCEPAFLIIHKSILFKILADASAIKQTRESTRAVIKSMSTIR